MDHRRAISLVCRPVTCPTVTPAPPWYRVLMEVRMRRVCLLVLVSSIGSAQTALPPAPALVRGVLLERDTPAASGEFSVRAPDNQVFRYRFDAKTYVERENQMIDVPRLQPGEK